MSVSKLSDLKLSPQLRTVLKESVLVDTPPKNSKKKSGPSNKRIEERTPLSFLVAAAKHLTRNRTASASIFNYNRNFLDHYDQSRMLEQAKSDPDQLSLLDAALVDAKDIRQRTGGKDQFLGLRHVLFTVLVPEDPDLYQATYEALAKGGTDPSRLSNDIAAFCQAGLEQGEKGQVWRGIVDERLKTVQQLQTTLIASQVVAPFLPDDPWAETAVDRSGARYEAQAFATMICWHDFRPPLAVGVFGDWGAGKSFFMRLVHDAIKERCDEAKSAKPCAAKSDPTFLEHVVQIRFNAWHYAETNLWASLVDHMLTQLNQWATLNNREEASNSIFNKLDTAREWTLHAAETLARRRVEVDQLTEARDDAKKALDEQRQKLEGLPELWAESAWSSVLNDPELKTSTAKAAAELGVTEDVSASVGELRSAIQLYSEKGGGSAVRSLWQLAIHHTGWTVALILSILLLPPLLMWVLAGVTDATEGAAIAGVLSPLAAYGVLAARHLRNAHATLTRVYTNVQAEIVRKTRDEASTQEDAAAALAKARKEEEAAKIRLKEASKAVDELQKEYQAQDGRVQLLEFVRRRASSGDYRKQLGFIAQIRRDFDELSRLMQVEDQSPESKKRLEKHKRDVGALLNSAAGERLTDEEAAALQETTNELARNEVRAFKRIVLYIDDLDRCPPEKVVVVLQAIHLLLAYPLFVVFVAVDVRWLKKALEKEYPQFSAEQNKEQASPEDYLEKIFQIPYWVRAMNTDATKALMADHVGPTVSTQPDPGDTSGPTAPNPDGSDAAPPTDDKGPEKSATGVGKKKKTRSESSAQEQGAPTIQLNISENELAFMEKVADSLDGSPRRTLRYVNSYRLIKAGLNSAQRVEVEDDAFRTVLFLLAVQIAMPDVFQQIVAADGNLDSFEPASEISDEAQCAKFRKLLTVFKADGGEIPTLSNWIEPVARFSFERCDNGALEGVGGRAPNLDA